MTQRIVLASLSSGLGGNVADRWAAAIVSPAFLFWGGGILATGWLDDLADDFKVLSGTEQAAVAVAALLGVIVSGVVVQALSLPTLRMLEGYWPRFARPLSRAMTGLRDRRLATAASRWRSLALADRERTLTADERDEYGRLDRSRRAAPARQELRMPTRLGNVLRVAELRPRERYGLDAIVCWPRLWLAMPEDARAAIAAARQAMDVRAEVWVWAVLFCAWGAFRWWAPLIGIAVAAGAYRSLTGAAAGYGDLVVASYDVYRGDLYRALGWPQPTVPAEEPALGQALTRYLERGVAPAELVLDTDTAEARAPAH